MYLLMNNIICKVFGLFFICFLMVCGKIEAQDVKRIEYPYVIRTTADDVFIKEIILTPAETIVKFITYYTGHYIYLSPSGHLNALYIRCNGFTYNLKRTIGIASSDKQTICEPNQFLEFAAVFEPIPTDRRTGELDLIEGINGTWNYYQVRLSNLSSVVPDLHMRARRKYNEVVRASRLNQNPMKRETKRLKKNPNFKIE